MSNEHDCGPCDRHCPLPLRVVRCVFTPQPSEGSISSRLYEKLRNKGLDEGMATAVMRETLELDSLLTILKLHDRTTSDDKPPIHRIEVLVWVLADSLLKKRKL